MKKVPKKNKIGLDMTLQITLIIKRLFDDQINFRVWCLKITLDWKLVLGATMSICEVIND